MLTVAEALAQVIEQAEPLPAVEEALRRARGCRLAEDITATADQPPFTRSLVDGFAVRSTDFLKRKARLRLVETIVAGHVPTRTLKPGETAAIMTGAPLPPGADAVIMHEQSRREVEDVAFDAPHVQPGANIQEQGRIYRSGTTILKSGCLLGPAALALLAAVGRTRVRIIPRPGISILPTGDELVEPDQDPGPGQIRNSNAVMLEALAAEHGEVVVAAIAPDEIQVLTQRLNEGLKEDVLIITGGVSVGERDLVPACLLGLGVRQVFHKVRLKPGKPLWFGIGPPRGDLPGTVVFGLPGNPVSGLMGFLLFIAPALRRLAGHPAAGHNAIRARLGNRFVQRGNRPTYFPVILRDAPADKDSDCEIETLDWAGSADLVGIARADGLAIFPEGERVFQPGEIVPFLPLDALAGRGTGTGKRGGQGLSGPGSSR